MADRIRLLPEVVANQIAAGEVVNRPASVVKEMMENSIDAGATRVQVNFRDGGRDLIQIVDDGCGMSPIDARMAFDRHATSKIAAVEDIYALSTFGFRGEALASIAAVAQVELRTRQEGDDVGTCTEINGGQFVSQTPVMCPVGSQFYVRNLFYNVPARRRFLDKSTTSAAQIRTEFQRVALCNPHIGFELYSNDAPVYTLAASSLAGRIVDVVGRHIKQNLLEVEADTSIARVEGFIGRPAAAKRRNTEQYLFVNGRFFKSAYLTGAILKAYEKLIPENCTPSYFLYLTIDPSRIDVNVHPQKTEVKFADEDAVWQIVNAAVRETLAKTGAVPLMDFDREGGVEIPVLERGAVYSEPRAMSDESYNPFREEYVDPSAPEPDTDFTGFDVPYRVGGSRVSDATAAPYGSSRTGSPGTGIFGGGFTLSDEGETFEEYVSGGVQHAESELEFIPSAEDAEQQFLEIESRPSFTDPLPLAGGYVAALLGERLVVVDVRRARERILYENYLRMLGNGSAVSQQLLFPERLELSGDEYALLEENAVDVAALGFDLDYLGDGAVEVRGAPADLPAEGIDRMLYDLLQTFSLPVAAGDVRRERIAAAMALGAVRGAMRTLTREEAAALLEQLAGSDNFSYSPSGKAIFAEIPPEDIRTRLG
ncbi:DNA mismatch repair endonuclease MutL [uncultured Alistipes sp.]|uniref:DNA mismatch repair endonuclease MutL n=1 Tax=uncultured Alistipes sp. TaxID=538949 RepID=UPI00272A4D48|nr:DNA mismatch repair endonuclease MutL [uncultured Alistipes sp.]